MTQEVHLWSDLNLVQTVEDLDWYMVLINFDDLTVVRGRSSHEPLACWEFKVM